jgi:hypothetical protein
VRRRNKNLYVGITPTGYRDPVLWLAFRALYRWRWQLTPIYVALAAPFAAWTVAIIHAVADPKWTVGLYAVGGLCAAAWLAFGMRRLYDRLYGVAVLAAAGWWTLAVAMHPARGWLYGLWALGWPLLGLGWWCGPAFRSLITLDRMTKRWNSVAELAGIAGAKLTAVRNTPVGRVLTIILPGNHTARDVNRERIEAGYEFRPGSVTVVRDKKNARRIDLHVIERDPWESGRTIDHPLLAALPHLEEATTGDPTTAPTSDPDDPDTEQREAA